MRRRGCEGVESGTGKGLRGVEDDTGKHFGFSGGWLFTATIYPVNCIGLRACDSDGFVTRFSNSARSSDRPGSWAARRLGGFRFD